MNTPTLITDFAAAVARRNGRVFLVGGSVRDSLLGIAPKDFDLEVFGISATLVEEIAFSFFPGLKHVGRSFPVWHFATDTFEVDISLPRTERKAILEGGNPHTNFEVTFDPTLPLDVALSRRDFTINSIALDVLSGEVHDPFNGREDLSNRVLRPTSVAAFGDDPLRILRAAQFISRFNLEAHPTLITICKFIAPDLDSISAERKFLEFEKLLVKGICPGKGLDFLDQVWNLPNEIFVLIGCEQSRIHHAEGDVFNHTCFALDKAAEFGISNIAKWAVLCHDFGKPATTVTENGKTVAHDHENHIAPVVSFLSNLRSPKKLVDQVVVLVQEHLSPVRLENPSKLRKLARKLASVDLTVDDLIGVAKADQFGRIGTKSAEEINDRLDKFRRDFDKAIEVIDVRKPLISGKDLLALGFRSGPVIGMMLKLALDLEDDGNGREEILSIIKNTQ